MHVMKCDFCCIYNKIDVEQILSNQSGNILILTDYFINASMVALQKLRKDEKERDDTFLQEKVISQS
ncbi:hypothetical protein L1887_31860 [Cichorium endivia]|nr:hypothetical protein L1887_31860 [Cichorium endivia]